MKTYTQEELDREKAKAVAEMADITKIWQSSLDSVIKREDEIRAEMKAPGPCGKHPRMFWVENQQTRFCDKVRHMTDYSLCPNCLPEHCAICAEQAERGKRLLDKLKHITYEAGFSKMKPVFTEQQIAIIESVLAATCAEIEAEKRKAGK